MSIHVHRVSETMFQVNVEAGTATVHEVTLSQAYCEELTGGRASPELLVERSFEFLLEREPNTSILRRFELPVIQTYFPEYEKTMKSVFA